MGRSQVLYNRTKGRFRNRVKQQNEEQQHVDNSSSVAPQEDYYSSSKSRSASNNPKLNESDMLLLAQHPSPAQSNYNVDDDFTSALQSSTNNMNSNPPILDVASLATTLMTCMSLSQRLKIPSHIARTLEKEDVRSPEASQLANTPPVVNDREASFLQKRQKNIRPPESNSSSTLKEKRETNQPKILPAAPSLSDDHLPRRPSLEMTSGDASYSIGPNKIKPTRNGHVEVRINHEDMKQITEKTTGDDLHHSREYDVDHASGDDSHRSREYDVDRYASLDGEDDESDEEDSLETIIDTTRHANKKKYPPQQHMQGRSAGPKTKDKVAMIAKLPIDPPQSTTNYYPSQSNTKKAQQKDRPAAVSTHQDGSYLLEDWLDSVTAGEVEPPGPTPVNGNLRQVASKLGLPSDGISAITSTDESHAPVHEVDNLTLVSNGSTISTITRDATAISEEEHFWQGQRQKHSSSNQQQRSKQLPKAPASSKKIDDSIVSGGLGADSLDAWLDDVIS